jgi:PAS domain S-box-containing protein
MKKRGHPNAKRNQQHYTLLLNIFKNGAAYLPLIMIPFGLLVRAGQLGSDFYVNDTVFVAIVGVHSIVSTIYFYMQKYRPAKVPNALFMVIFHLLTLLYVLFVSGFLSAFLSVWIVLMISTDLLYKARGFFLSFAALALAGALSVVVRPEMPVNERIEVIQGIIVVGLIGYVIAKIRSITDHERNALHRTKEQESFQRERLLALVNSMGDAVVTTNEQGTIKVYNAALLGLLDTNASLTGKNIDDVLELRDRNKRKVSIVQDAQTARKVFSRTDLMHRFSKDEVMRLYINVAPIHPGYQSPAERGYIFIIRDITKEKTLEDERDEFISVVSHELRTPVAIAEGNLSNILLLQERGAAPDMVKNALSDAHQQIMYLAKIVNDLSTLSRAERGIDSEGTEQIDIKEFLTELYKKYLPQAQKQKLHLNLDLSPQLPSVHSSRLYLEEIMQNFVTNALKYTRSGSITIIGHSTDDGLYLAVKDTGIGISKSDQHHIFEKFYRSEDYRTRESSGTGLGLYISQKLASKLNIKVSFESRLNHGSTFSLFIKLPTPANE